MQGPFNKHSAAPALVLGTLVAPVAGKPLGALVAWPFSFGTMEDRPFIGV